MDRHAGMEVAAWLWHASAEALRHGESSGITTSTRSFSPHRGVVTTDQHPVILCAAAFDRRPHADGRCGGDDCGAAERRRADDPGCSLQNNCAASYVTEGRRSTCPHAARRMEKVATESSQPGAARTAERCTVILPRIQCEPGADFAVKSLLSRRHLKWLVRARWNRERRFQFVATLPELAPRRNPSSAASRITHATTSRLLFGPVFAPMMSRHRAVTMASGSSRQGER